jgi:UDP-N-acetylmuramyl-tripeptide synthetase
MRIESPIGGSFTVTNTLAACALATEIGIYPETVSDAISAVRGIPGRLESLALDSTKFPFSVLIDYAHTPMAFYNCLKTLKLSVSTKQSLIVVFGCGGNRDKGKRPVFGKYAELMADKIIITEDNSRTESFDSIVSDIAAGIEKKDFEIIKDRETAIRHAFKNARKGDVIAIIGKGHERYKIIQNEYISFDEKFIIRDEMKKRGWSDES